MKTDLRYFQQSTSTFLDRTIRRLITRHHADGYLVYQYLKCEIFRENGFYIIYDKFLGEDIAVWFSFIDKEEVEKIIFYCLEIGLFDKSVFEQHKVLTSKSIQENFNEISRRMKRKVQTNEYWLIGNLYEEDQSTDSKKKDETNEGFPGKFPNSKEYLPKIPETFANNSRTVPSNSGKFAGNKGNKGNEINKEISLYSDRERMAEIFFIEKNYPAEELDKFLNHYSKTGWKDKNGNTIKDLTAAAKNWSQLNSPHKFFIRPEHHKIWKKVWSKYKEAVGFEGAKHLLNVKPIINANTITFLCNQNEKDICEANIEKLKPILRNVLGKNLELYYKLTNHADEPIVNA